MATNKKRIAIIGGGPAALFLFKTLLDSENRDIEIDIFERRNRLGAGISSAAIFRLSLILYLRVLKQRKLLPKYILSVKLKTLSISLNLTKPGSVYLIWRS